MNAQVWLLLLGIVSGGTVPVITGIFGRKKIRAEIAAAAAAVEASKAAALTSEAVAADTLSKGAVRLVPYYEARIAGLELRLTAAEAAAALARLNEVQCQTRLDALQRQVDELRVLLGQTPLQTTTVSTTVTTVDAVPPTTSEVEGQ